MGTRKRHPAGFKARVALEAAKQTRTLACRFQSGWASLFRISGEQLTGCGVIHPTTRREG